MFTVIGLQKVDFTGNDGKKVDGIKIHATCEKEHVEGYAVDTFFLGRAKFGSILDTIKVGNEFNLSYNKYGKVENISII